MLDFSVAFSRYWDCEGGELREHGDDPTELLSDPSGLLRWYISSEFVDMHEAFAAQILSNTQAFASKSFAEQKLGRSEPIGEVDMDNFNVNGGSIALGHPFAATGARQIHQTLVELKRRGGGLGLVTACAAGGLGGPGGSGGVVAARVLVPADELASALAAASPSSLSSIGSGCGLRARSSSKAFTVASKNAAHREGKV